MPPSTFSIIAVLLAAVAFGNSSSAALDQAGIPGIWLNDRDDGEVEIKTCGDRLCGYVYSINYPNPVHPGEPIADANNENPSLRSRLICGIQVIGDLRKQDDGSWGEGWVYDPEAGKTYSIEVRLKELNVLVVHGYLGVKLLGETHHWVRSNGKWKPCMPKAH